MAVAPSNGDLGDDAVREAHHLMVLNAPVQSPILQAISCIPITLLGHNQITTEFRLWTMLSSWHMHKKLMCSCQAFGFKKRRGVNTNFPLDSYVSCMPIVEQQACTSR